MKNLILSYYIIVILGISACSSTKITSTWRESNKEISLQKLNKVLVVALLRDETSRRKAEDQMVSYFYGKGVASYDYLDKSISEKNEEAIREKIRKDRSPLRPITSESVRSFCDYANDLITAEKYSETKER